MHGFSIHIYADDTQIYIEFNPLFDIYYDIESRIITCLESIRNWMNLNKLKLNNPSKTEALVVKSKNNLEVQHSCTLHAKS